MTLRVLIANKSSPMFLLDHEQNDTEIMKGFISTRK